MKLHSPPAHVGSSRRCALAKVQSGPCRIRGKGAAAERVAGPRGTRVAGWRAQARTQTTQADDKASSAKGFQTILIENETEITKWPGKPHDLDDYQVMPEADVTDLQPLIDKVRAMLRSMNDGEISISAYDTAWVALVPKLDGGEGPQFPATVRWIVDNQLPDGSWGDSALFSAYDRTTNTLACVVALRKWSLEPEKCKTGLSFLHENMWRLAEEEQESMPIGFEIAFPSLIQTARSLDIDFPYDHPALQSIYSNREIKLKRIPKDMMHRVPTSILHSLEGMPDLDWAKLLNLQSSDGSFLYSPSATAYALMQTGDKKCFDYIDKIVKKFDGGVPNVYPVDLFEHIWVVDRLERLGISHYFKREIKQCMDYVYRHWTEEGICWARNSNVKDVDDTAMAFRLLRLHGYNVSPSVFKNFEKDGEFFCFVGQSTQAVTGMYNLNRASQIAFQGEDVLHRAKIFSYEFLRQREARGMLRDKWIIAKDLAGEVQYTLDFPWYASLPRVEARTYLDQYGGKDDVWIGKTLYRMPLVNNDEYLELARMDFNRCQVLHQLECHGLQMWYIENGLGTFGVAPEDILKAYFLAAACIFEPSRAAERLAWARALLLANTISAHFHNNLSDKKRLECFAHCLYEENDVSWLKRNPKDGILVRALWRLTDLLAQEAESVQERQNYTRNLLRLTWTEWMMQKTSKEDDKYNKSSAKEPRYMVLDRQTYLLLVQIIEICAGRIDEATSVMDKKDSDRFIQLACSICDSLDHKVLLSQDTEKNEATINRIDNEIELDMQELAQSLLMRSDEKTSNSKTKQTLWHIVRSSYYATHCPPYMMDRHVSRVIFEPV
ncbi:ent-copalyl diphosphate synthase AN1, chloroplastic-like isoform X2 [Phragmites australis]|uniref:ent-copalyl diphosphate synthase AN1, chloroplastic-like isoform X2 n=1 Tax=Phragmites australis TaxID=29695 RepID=UPI002D79C9AB|nr:ent-copalyl diphosphate synthase AN1, chloroplastic-like isoform X2 [Phragmites australis]